MSWFLLLYITFFTYSFRNKGTPITANWYDNKMKSRGSGRLTTSDSSVKRRHTVYDSSRTDCRYRFVYWSDSLLNQSVKGLEKLLLLELEVSKGRWIKVPVPNLDKVRLLEFNFTGWDNTFLHVVPQLLPTELSGLIHIRFTNKTSMKLKRLPLWWKRYFFILFEIVRLLLKDKKVHSLRGCGSFRQKVRVVLEVWSWRRVPNLREGGTIVS